jgi:hypothetical protein
MEQNQTNMTEYFNSAKNRSNCISLKLKKKIINALIEFVVLDSRPFEIVNGQSFINLIECVLNAGRSLLESSTVSASDLIADPRTVKLKFILLRVFFIFS